jgi:hypothetical protein
MMKGPKRGGSSNLLLALVCALLAGVVYLEIEAAPAPAVTPPEPPATAEPPAALPSAVAYRAPEAAAFSGVLERPLFAPSRRPPPDAPPPAVEAAPEASPFELELVGVVISGEERVALVRQPGIQELLRVAVGRMVGGWQVETIEPDRVLFRSGDTLKEVRLRDDTPPPETRRSRREREAERRRRAEERRERLEDERAAGNETAGEDE